MKHVISIMLLTVLLAISFEACKKDQTVDHSDFYDLQLISLAKAYFHDSIENSTQHLTGNFRIDAAKTIDWAAAEVYNLSNGPAVIVPVHYTKNLFVKTNLGADELFSLDDIAHLVLYVDKANVYHAELVTAFPDTTALNNYAPGFTGIIFVENWAGQRLHQFKYNADGTILTFTGQQTNQQKGSIIDASANTLRPAMIITTCYEIVGYNYSAGDPGGGYSWTESLGCTSMYIAGDFTGGGGGSGGSLPAYDYGSVAGYAPKPVPLAIVARGPSPIANIIDYLKCFTNVGGADHTYTVTVCVDQPAPGTREPWHLQNSPSASSAASNPVDVGHTFLIFSETYGGTTITRNVGFYPLTGVNPYYPSDQGQLNNNESSIYNISLTVTVNNAQFFNMLNYVSQGNDPGYLYDLNSNNCTTFVINTLRAGFVNLSSQLGSWFKGSGYDPGDLGEDIRNMPLSTNMSRNTVDNPHPNVGNCN